MQHDTTKPEQAQTDNWLVFRDGTHTHGNVELLKQVEVPLFSQPNRNGVPLSKSKRLALAVARAVESDDSFVSSFDDPTLELTHDAEFEAIEGERFMVMTEMDQETFEWVEYERNPAFDAVWDPEVEA